jgi:hypothetical protein
MSLPIGRAEPQSGEAQSPPELTRPELLRYARHIVMPEVGMDGQKKLKGARVAMIGAGGLGSPLGLYLAAAGVGTLGLVEFDVVDESNLQRQVLHGTSDVGKAVRPPRCWQTSIFTMSWTSGSSGRSNHSFVARQHSSGTPTTSACSSSIQQTWTR